MRRIKNSRRLIEALQQLSATQARRNALEARIESLRQAIVVWYERKNRTQFIDPEGNVWRKLQASTVFYNDEAFKTLLKRRGIDPEDVYHVVEIEERDEEAIKKLLAEKKISIREWRKIATIHYHKSYVRKFAPEKERNVEKGKRSGGGSNRTNKG